MAARRRHVLRRGGVLMLALLAGCAFVWRIDSFEHDAGSGPGEGGVVADGMVDSGCQITMHDEDHDCVADGSDNCPTISNPPQGNMDSDGVGDTCDLFPALGGDSIAYFTAFTDLSGFNVTGAPNNTDHETVTLGITDRLQTTTAITKPLEIVVSIAAVTATSGSAFTVELPTDSINCQLVASKCTTVMANAPSCLIAGVSANVETPVDASISTLTRMTMLRTGAGTFQCVATLGGIDYSSPMVSGTMGNSTLLLYPTSTIDVQLQNVIVYGR